jgi:peptide/nickel transport system substrate-binding protein
MAGDATLATGCLAQGTFGYSQQTMPAYDPEQTKSMLAQAGYANGFSVELKTADYLPKQREIGDTIVAQLAEVGVNATLNDQDQAAWIKDLLALNWDMELIGTGALNGDGDYALGRLYMSTAKRTGWSSSEMDSILQQEEAQLDPSQRQQEFDSACKLLLDQGPTIFLFNSVQDYGLRSNVQGFVPRVDQILFLKDVGVS